VAAERLGQHVVHTRALQHSTHRATGDDTGTGAGRTEQHHTGGFLTLHRVRNGACDAGHAEEVLLGLLDALGDRRGHLLGLAVADADLTVAVTDHDQSGEAEATTTLDDLGHAVDRYNALEVRVLVLGRPATATVTTVPAVPAATALAVLLLAGSALAAGLPRTSRHQAFLPFSNLLTIRIPTPLRERRRPAPRSGRGRRCRPGRTPRTRHPRSWRGRPPVRRPWRPWPSCRPRRRPRRPRASTQQPACGPRRRRSAARRCAGRSASPTAADAPRCRRSSCAA